MTKMAHDFLLQPPTDINTIMRFQCASMTGSVLSTLATLWLPYSPLYTDFLGASKCLHQAIK